MALSQKVVEKITETVFLQELRLHSPEKPFFLKNFIRVHIFSCHFLADQMHY